ncbi:MAG: hypothetical protein A4S12_06300 [Proteobacteria bacterium SG_bin5]|nr:hypothetical protein [Sphingomonas sp.]OQW42881.1 MAG: hypothetical protein A4S12_06300 [Proteobacteria bacterium SG_bin5]
MVVPRRAQPRASAFSRMGLLVLIGSLALHAAQLATQTTFPVLFLGNLVALVFLRWQASALLRRRADFDAVIAAEMIVAFGVLSLILGISTAVIPLFLGTATLRVDSLAALAGIAIPFLEGLATAGLAPFFAVLLRIEAHEAGSSEPGAELSELTIATQDLGTELRGAVRALREMREQLAGAAAQSQALGQAMQTEAAKLMLMVERSETKFAALAAAADKSSDEVVRLATETARLNQAAGDTSALLTTLGDLIDSVERFVKPVERA